MDETNLDRIPVLLMARELGIGGTERQLVETARFLQRDRFVPHVGCFRPDGLRRRDLEQAGVPILHLPVYSFKSPAVLSCARQLIRYIREHRIQIVHSFDAPLNAFAVPVARLAGTPAVISSQRGHRDLTGQGMKRALRITDHLVDAVVVNCLWMKQCLVEEEHVPDHKIRLCYNAVDLERYRPGARPTTTGGATIGTVCALRPEKGVDTLIRAVATVQQPGVKLLIVGSGPEEAKLRALCTQLGVAEACHFEPATNNVAEWLGKIDIFVLPSRFEALSNSLMEAMACGCCPVASRVGGNPELVEHGESGLLFRADDVAELAGQLQELLTDEPRRKRLAAAAAIRMSTQFTSENFINTMQGIYESVLSEVRG
jgi:glycosyltransferase involved in cell wall biosynthesis